MFRTYPSQAKGANEFEIARNRIAAAEVYMRSVAPYSADDVEQAVDEFLTGRVPGHNAAFAPTAPQVGAVCRRAMERRLESQERTRRYLPRLPAPDIEHTEAQRAKAKAQVQAFIEGQAAATVHEHTEDDKRRRERWAKTNARFQPPMDDASISQRLLGYSVGSPESEDNAA